MKTKFLNAMLVGFILILAISCESKQEKSKKEYEAKWKELSAYIHHYGTIDPLDSSIIRMTLLVSPQKGRIADIFLSDLEMGIHYDDLNVRFFPELGPTVEMKGKVGEKYVRSLFGNELNRVVQRVEGFIAWIIVKKPLPGPPSLQVAKDYLSLKFWKLLLRLKKENHAIHSSKGLLFYADFATYPSEILCESEKTQKVIVLSFYEARPLLNATYSVKGKKMPITEKVINEVIAIAQ